MLSYRRCKQNPLLSADTSHEWEANAVFNGSVVKDTGNLFRMVYRAMSKEKDHHGHRMSLSSIGYAVSADGIRFDERKQFIPPELEWERYGCEDPRITYFEGKYYIFYTALSSFQPDHTSIKVAVAVSDDLKSISKKYLVTPFNAKAMALFPERINGKITVIFSYHTDILPAHIVIAQCDSIEDLWSDAYWREWENHLDNHRVHLKRMKTDQVEVGAVPLKTKYGWLLLYSYIRDYTTKNPLFTIEAALLDKNNPQRVTGRAEQPLLQPEEMYEFEGQIRNIVFPSGATLVDDDLRIYYGAADSIICLAHYSLSNILQNIVLQNVEMPRLTRFEGNPLLEPKPWHEWESQGAFNAGVIRIEDETFILYRALSSDNVSTIGLAITHDGFHIDERLSTPVYVPRENFEMKKEGSGGGGCEDPRLIQIGDKIYMFYTAYNGIDNPRVAMSSIVVSDLVKRKLEWSTPVLISPPGVDDKDACIFPEKINGKYVIMHRIEPNIVIDSVDSLTLGNGKWLKTESVIPPRKGWWDSKKIGISAPPIKTKDGWLLLYHGISTGDNEYRVGAMLLDARSPYTVLARTNYPLLEPEMKYEKDGIVPNVVFPCGLTIIDDTLFVYYGGADKVTALATISLPLLLGYLKEQTNPRYLI